MPLAHHVTGIKIKVRLLPGTVEVVENPQALGGVEFYALGAESGEVGRQVGPDPREIGAGLLHILLGHGDGHILLLRDAVGAGPFVHEHLVILFAVSVAAVLPQGHEDRFLKGGPIERAVVNCDLGGGARVQAVQQL